MITMRAMMPLAFAFVACSGAAFKSTPDESTAGATTTTITQGGASAIVGMTSASAGDLGAAGADAALGHGGDPCAADSDCDASAGLACIVKAGIGTTCQVPVIVQSGASCSGASEACPSDYFCARDSLICTHRRRVDNSCGQRDECEAGLSCAGFSATVFGLCEPEASQ